MDQAIAERAVAYEAEQLGFRISDKDLATTLRSFPFANLPPDQYQQYVEQSFGTTVPAFEDNVRVKGYEDAIQLIVGEGSIVTPAEASVGGRPLLISTDEDGSPLAEPRLITGQHALPATLSISAMAWISPQRGRPEHHPNRVKEKVGLR